ncbi:hypothetical protein OK18_07980 [Chryseobacterium gallinarum]|uniref:Uncharacterized protein n=1 Tax=Chryseobacterium gallinarum TaxID=1324352 RepID=A0A0G3M144_CHRGL|nr:class I lanthipeptide [Chryseobacterium gallinarum]AKK72574.1 hypothetical protein OK18_07980 [Chryseobacterium gallinarum]
MKSIKKTLNLKKETLIKLQEKQMKALAGAGDMSNSEYNELALLDNSCCKRSCNVAGIEIGLELLDESCCKRTCNR